MRALAVIAAALALSACAGASTPMDGVANYDALSKARSDCLAKGGELSLINGGDPQVLGDFKCKRK
jgi:hypothetical protein